MTLKCSAVFSRNFSRSSASKLASSPLFKWNSSKTVFTLESSMFFVDLVTIQDRTADVSPLAEESFAFYFTSGEKCLVGEGNTRYISI